MASKTKTQLDTDITTNIGSSYSQSALQTVLTDIVDSYEDIFANVTTVQRDAITPTNGLIVYNTDNARYEYWNGVTWMGIGQDLSTPMVVKVDLSSADILSLDTVPVSIVSAPGSGYALQPTTASFRYTGGSTGYSGTANAIKILSSTAVDNDEYLISVMPKSALTTSDSTGIATPSGGSPSPLKENDSIVIKADGTLTTGDGTLTVWVTYSIITW